MNSLEKIIALAEQQGDAGRRIDMLEAELKEAKEIYRQITENDIPEAMEALGLTEFSLKDGRTIRLEQRVHASIPKGRESVAFKWLRDNNYDSIIKREINFRFGKGDDGVASQLVDLIKQALSVVPDHDKESVHHSTLKAFVRELLEDGVQLPEEAFGILRRTVAKVDDSR
jgi:hypothetical protein